MKFHLQPMKTGTVKLNERKAHEPRAKGTTLREECEERWHRRLQTKLNSKHWAIFTTNDHRFLPRSRETYFSVPLPGFINRLVAFHFYIRRQPKPV